MCIVRFRTCYQKSIINLFTSDVILWVNVVKRLSGLEQSISEDNEQKLNFLYNAIQDTQKQ